MNRLLMIFTVMLTLALMLGKVYYPDFPFVWIASDATGFIFVRAAIVAVLTALLFNGVIGLSIVRPFLPVAAGGLAALTAALLFTDSLNPVDAVIFIETTVVLALEFLESQANTAPSFATRPIGKFGVGNDFVKIS